MAVKGFVALPPSRNCSCERLIEIARQRVFEFPRDRHRSLADVAAIGSRAEEPKGAVVSVEAGEQHDAASVALLVPVAQAGRSIGACGRLALPVDEVAADRVVAIASRRREAAAALVERECEQLGVCRFRFVDAALPCGDLGSCAEPEGGEDLEPAVPGVDLQRAVRVCGERSVQVVDSTEEDSEQLQKFAANLRVCPEQFERLVDARVRLDHTIGEGSREHVEESALSLGESCDRRPVG